MAGVQIHLPEQVATADLLVLYRISSGGYPKDKPSYITKPGCLANALGAISEYDESKFVAFVCIADNCTDELREETIRQVKSCERLSEKSGKGVGVVIPTRIGNGAGSFTLGAKIAAAVLRKPDALVYMLEDDYLHTEGAIEKIADGLRFGAFSTGYDHPDKYRPLPGGGRIPLTNEDGTEKDTRVHLGKRCYFKRTNSTTMTFMCTHKTLVTAMETIQTFTDGTHPHDFFVFLALRERHEMCVVTCLPACSTHGETAFLAPFVDWEAEAAKFTRAEAGGGGAASGAGSSDPSGPPKSEEAALVSDSKETSD